MKSSTWRAIGTVSLLAALLLFAHPYDGIRHDGSLYAGEALARFVPGEFHQDLYFLYGSQGRFTVLPALYARLIETFGLGAGTIVGLLSAMALYLAAAAYFVAAVVPSRYRALALMSVILGWSLYGGTRVFAYAEPFLTARSFAEPAVLLGLGLLVRGRLILAGLALAVGVLMHPLIAFGGLLVAGLYLLQQDRRWLWAAAAAVAAFAVLSATPPLADLWSTYDDVWLAQLRELNPQAFVLQWSILDFGIIAFNVCVLGMAWHEASDPVARRLILAALVAGAAATLTSLVMVDVALNPFFGKLQIWRAEWIMQWVAMASLPLLAGTYWKRGGAERVAACLLVIGWLAPFSIAPALVGAAAVLLVALRGRLTISSGTTRIVAVVTAAVALMLFVQVEARVWTLEASLHQPVPRVLGQVLSSAVLLAAIGGALARWRPRRAWVSTACGVALFLVSASLWDQRSAWTRSIESHSLDRPLWNDLIEPQAKVYWYRDLIAPWILLGHGNYYAPQQGSGAVFSRDMVVELARRKGLTANLEFQEELCRMMNNLNGKQASCEPDKVAVKGICQDAGIDYMVLQSRLEATQPLAEYATGVVENGFEKRLFLYRCSSI